MRIQTYNKLLSLQNEYNQLSEQTKMLSNKYDALVGFLSTVQVNQSHMTKSEYSKVVSVRNNCKNLESQITRNMRRLTSIGRKISETNARMMR